MSKFIATNIEVQLPEFVQSQHPLFTTFVKAYYEWLESKNDSDGLTLKTMYEKVDNPSALVNKINENKDIDNSADAFIQFFKNEILPFASSAPSADDRYLVKKIRDVYLSKGTPNSYKLLFRLLYGIEIDVFETNEQILEASEGRYNDFTVMNVKVIEGETTLEDVDLGNVTIDSDGVQFAISIFGAKRGTINGKTYITFLLNKDPGFSVGDRLNIKDTVNRDKSFIAEVVPHLSELKPLKDIGGYSVGDSIKVTDSDREFVAKVTSVTRGPVTSIIIKDRGVGYKKNESISFMNGKETGGSVLITEVDSAGRILEIDSKVVRTGSLNNGYLSDDFTEVEIPITDGGNFSDIPSVSISSKEGYGADIRAISNKIGRITQVDIPDKGFFEDSEGVTVEPIVLQMSSPVDLVVGQTVRFQKFQSEPIPFADDSEVIRFALLFTQRTLTAQDSEDVVLRLPYDFDTDSFLFLDSEYYIDSSDSDIPETFITKYNSSNKNSQFVARYPDASIAEDSDFMSKNKIPFDKTVLLTLKGETIRSLDTSHFNTLDTYNDSDKYVSITKYLTQDTYRVLDSDTSSGKFINTRFIGKISAINENKNVVKLESTDAILDSDLYPQDSDMVYNSRYSLLRVMPVNTTTNENLNKEKFPYDNIVGAANRQTFAVNYEAISKTSKAFLNEAGFLNSESGGVLRDNLFYDTFTYNIQSTKPISEWRETAKKTIHPAGMNLFSELNVDAEKTENVSVTVDSGDKNFQHNMRFDADHTHHQFNEANIGVDTTNHSFDTNAYTIKTSEPALTTSNSNTVSEKINHRIHGNSWWDYEPVGLINSFSSQDYDSEGIVEKVYEYNAFRDSDVADSDAGKYYFKGFTNRHPYDTNSYKIMETNFGTDGNKWSTFDSDINLLDFSIEEDPDHLYEFQAIKYDDDLSTKIPVSVDRDWEYEKQKDADFQLAMHETKLLSYKVGDITYYDFDAFEIKWNQVNDNWTDNKEGWEIQGFTSVLQNLDGENYRQKDFLTSVFIKEKTPLDQNIWNTHTSVVWEDSHSIAINKSLSYVNYTLQADSDALDPDTLMEDRRN